MTTFAQAVSALAQLEYAEQRELQPIRTRYAAQRAALIAAIDDVHPACACGHKASDHELDGCYHQECDNPGCENCLCDCPAYTPKRRTDP